MVPTPESVGATLRSSSATSSTTNEASAAFSLAYKGEITSARVNLVTALPGDSVAFDVLGSAPSGNFTLTAERGTVTPSGTGGWWWHAPSTPGLSRIVARAGGEYQLSLNLLKMAKEQYPDVRTKSSIMLGLGETEAEIEQVLRDLLDAGCDRITIGQYLKPSKDSLEVVEYVTPAKFDFWKQKAVELGFSWVISGPFARSSYFAERQNAG